MPDSRPAGKAAARPGGGRPGAREITVGPMVKRPLESTLSALQRAGLLRAAV